jgi:hypothetical protein
MRELQRGKPRHKPSISTAINVVILGKTVKRQPTRMEKKGGGRRTKEKEEGKGRRKKDEGIQKEAKKEARQTKIETEKRE